MTSGLGRDRAGEPRPCVVNVGSLNIDRVLRVPHLVRPGETLLSRSVRVFAGGKGANQSVALARAGAAVTHCGKVGPDGAWLIDMLAVEGVETRFVTQSDVPTGQALIQVADDGQNAIVLLAGANQELTSDDIEAVLADRTAGTLVLTQNETNLVAEVIERATARGLPVAFNPAPFTPAVLDYPIQGLALLIANESEGQGLTGHSTPGDIVAALRSRLPATEVVLTLGAGGVLHDGPEGRMHVPAFPVEVADTTAAGDTFIGYFITSRLNGAGVRDSLRTACFAAAISASRSGAIDSIPARGELEGFKSGQESG
jgi:ribokinase